MKDSELSAKLEFMLTFLGRYKGIFLSVSFLDFLTENLWDRVPVPLNSELLKLSTDALCALPTCNISSSLSASEFHDPESNHGSTVDDLQFCTLHQFIQDVERHRLEHLGVLDSVVDVMKECNDQEQSGDASSKIDKIKGPWGVRPKMNSFMTEKKSHEVETMANVVATLAMQCNIKQIVDIGSGKGYLGQCLALQYSLNVLGIDSSHVNSKGAQVRGQKLRKQWPTGGKNKTKSATNDGNSDGSDEKVQPMKEKTRKGSSDLTSHHQTCPKESRTTGFHLEKKQQVSPLPSSSDQATSSGEKDNPNSDVHDCVMKPDISDSNDKIANIEGAISMLNEMTVGPCSCPSPASHAEGAGQGPQRRVTTGATQRNSSMKTSGLDLYTPITTYVDTDTDLCQLLHGSCLDHDDLKQQHQPVLLCGLHTCGDLSPSILRLFLSNPSVPILCNVPCCHHLLTEEFEDQQEKRQSSTEDNSEGAQPNTYGFPMSDYLRSQKAKIGRVSKMVSCMAAEKLAYEKNPSTEKLFYRAVLQVILKENYTIPTRSQRTGKLASKCKTFVEYTRRALKKMGYVEDKLSEEHSKEDRVADARGALPVGTNVRKSVHQQLSDDEIQQYYTKYEPEMKKLEAFNLLRATLAPSIEALILLDKLCFLREQDAVKNAHLVRLFDPIKSPRCHAIIATK